MWELAEAKVSAKYRGLHSFINANLAPNLAETKAFKISQDLDSSQRLSLILNTKYLALVK